MLLLCQTCRDLKKVYPIADYPIIEIRGFKWPYRPTYIAPAYLLGKDAFGRWLGFPDRSPWRLADGSLSGVAQQPFVKLVPDSTWWTVNFYPNNPLIDVDIVYPVTWIGDVLEELDLELDVLAYADGSIHVRDQDKFDE